MEFAVVAGQTCGILVSCVETILLKIIFKTLQCLCLEMGPLHGNIFQLSSIYGSYVVLRTWLFHDAVASVRYSKATTTPVHSSQRSFYTSEAYFKCQIKFGENM
jgi:hypothetical protein